MKKTKILVLSLLSVLTIGALTGCRTTTNSGGSGPITTSHGGGDDSEPEIVNLEMGEISVGYDKNSKTVTATFGSVTGAARYELQIFKSNGAVVENSLNNNYVSGTPIDVSGYGTGTYSLKVRAISSDTTRYADSRWKSGRNSFTISVPNTEVQLEITSVSVSFTRNSDDTAKVTVLCNALPNGVTTTLRIYKITDDGNVKVEEKSGYAPGSDFRTRVLEIGKYKASIQANAKRNVLVGNEMVDYLESEEVMGAEELVIDAAPVVKPTLNLAIVNATVEKVENNYVFSWGCENAYNGICYEVTIKDSEQNQIFIDNEITSTSITLTETYYPAGDYYFSVKALGTDRLATATYIDSEEVTVQKTLTYENGGGETPVDPPAPKEIKFTIGSWTEENGVLTINVTEVENVEKISFLIKEIATSDTIIQEEETEIKDVYTFNTSSLVKDREYRCTVIAKNETEGLTRVRTSFEFTHTVAESLFNLTINSVEQYYVDEGVMLAMIVNTNKDYLAYRVKVEQGDTKLFEETYYNRYVSGGVCLSDEFLIRSVIDVEDGAQIKITVTAVPQDSSLPERSATRQCTIAPVEESYTRYNIADLGISFGGVSNGYYTITGNQHCGLKIQFSTNALTISEVNADLSVRAGNYRLASVRVYNTGKDVFEYAYGTETAISVEIEIDDSISTVYIEGTLYEYYGGDAPTPVVTPDYPLTLNGDVIATTMPAYELQNGKFDMNFEVEEGYYNRGTIDSSNYANNTLSCQTDVLEINTMDVWNNAFTQKSAAYYDTQAGQEELYTTYGFDIIRALRYLKQIMDNTNTGVTNTGDTNFVAYQNYIDSYDGAYVDTNGQTHNAEMMVYAVWLPNRNTALFVVYADGVEMTRTQVSNAVFA